MTSMKTTPRQRARAALVAQIKSSALQQIAESGAQHLSLRAIARELGMVSSGIYRYFASREELLTALIVDAYTDLAAALDEARRDELAARQQWRATCAALRAFARAQPHRFQLIYGTPIGGYRAPADTVTPAAQVAQALAAPVSSAARAGALGAELAAPTSGLAQQLVAMDQALGGQIPPPVLATTMGAIAQLLGLLTLELGGHFVGTFEPADALYEHAVDNLADQLGLP